MSRRELGIASAFTVAAMAVAAVLVGSLAPADMQLPIHWNIRGEPDDFAGKWAALFLPVGLAAVLSLLFWFLPALEPRKQGLERSQGLYLWGWASLLILSVAIELAVVATALGWALPASRLILCAAGAMLVLIGNQLGKSRSMYLVGIRTPWTLASESVWVRTHRLGGKLMVGAGLVTIASVLLPLSARLLPIVLLTAIGAAIFVPVVYSFLLWRREQATQSSE